MFFQPPRAWFMRKDGASPLAESPPVTFSRDQHARLLLDPSCSRLDSSSMSDYLSLSNLWLTLCPLLLPSTHSFFKLVLPSSPPRSGLLSPSSSPRRYAEVMNGICGIFGSETCYYVMFLLSIRVFFPLAFPGCGPAWMSPSGRRSGERAEPASTSE